LWAALAPLARPEMGLFTVLVLAVAEWRMRAQPLRARLLVWVPTIAFVGGWMLYCLLVTGYPLPSSFYVKFKQPAGVFRTQSHGHLRAGVAVLAVVCAWNWVCALGVGAVALFRRGLVAGLIAAFPLLFLLVTAGSLLIYQPWYFYWQRYLLPAHALLLLTLAVGAVTAVAWAWQRRRRAWARSMPSALPC